MPRPYTAKTLSIFLLVSAVFTALISPASAASINYSSSNDWNSGVFDSTDTYSGDLILGYDEGTAEDVDASKYSSISGDTAFQEYLTGVEVNGISYSSGDNSGYLDVTNQTSQEFKPGKSYPITVDFNIGIDTTDYISVAFDWDGDGELNNEAQTIGSCSTSCSVSDTIEVPEKASLNSSVLMRVIGSSTANPNPTSEDDTRWGEVEDYSAFIPGYTNSGSYSTEWINTDRLASWHNLSYRANISTETSTSLEVEVSEDGSTVSDSSSFSLEDGNNTLNITGLDSAPYIRVNPTLSTTNVKQTPRIEGLQVNHKLINITEKGLSNYSDQHRFNISAVAAHPNGSESFRSCKVYITDNNDFGGYQELGGDLIPGEEPVLDSSYGSEGQASCNATISQDLSGINLGDNLSYYFQFKDKDSVKRVTEELTAKLPNRRPEINSTSFEASSDSHSFNFSAVGYDVDGGSPEIASCTVYVEDGSGNSFSGRSLNRSGGTVDQAFCNATISSSDGFDPGEPLDVWAEFTDIGGLTGSSAKTQGEVPNHEPLVESLNTVPDEAGHSFDVDAVFRDPDTESDLTNGACRVYLTDGESSVAIDDSQTEISNSVTGDGEASCSYNVDASLSENFSVGEEIEAKVEFTDEWGASVNSSAILQQIPNNEPEVPEGLSLEVGDTGSVIDHRFNISFTNSGDPDGDDVTVKAYVGTSEDPSFVEDSISFASSESGEQSLLSIGSSAQLTDGEKYFIELEACDEYGLCNSTGANTSFTMNDEPNIRDAGSSTNPLTLSDGDETSISANITDSQSEIEWAFFEVENVTGGDWTLSKNRTSKTGDFWNSSSFQVSNNTNYEWSLTTSDGFESSTTSGSFGTGETPPIIDNLSLRNVEGEHSFTVNANISDSDGADTIAEANLNISDGDGNYATYSPAIVNISDNKASIEESSVDSSIDGFQIGEVVDVELTLVTENGTTMTDLKSKKIPNRPPEITGVEITPSNPETDEVLEANYIISDPEGDAVPESNREYQWFMDGSFIPITGKTVSTSSTQEGQYWNVSVQVQDEYGATSDTKYAEQKETIVNSLPEISREINTESLGDHRFEVSSAAQDPNGQEDFTGCTVTVEQNSNSKKINSEQDSTYGSTNELLCTTEIGPSTADWIEPTEEVNVTFSFTDDGNEDASAEKMKTVPNQRPSVDILSPVDENFSSSSVTFDWEMSDMDGGDSLSANVKVFDESGEVWKSGEIPASSTIKELADSAYTWNVTVTDSYDSTSLSSTVSSSGSFIVDTTAPVVESVGATSANKEYERVEQNDSLKIYSKWTDNFELDKAKIYENLTESNQSISSAEFEDGWANTTVPASQVQAGKVSYTVYAFDHLGNMKKEQRTVEIEDTEKPKINEVSFTPEIGDQPGFDPGKTVEVEASILDNLKVSNVELRYSKNSSETWNSEDMTESSGSYSGSFTPSEEGLYHFSVFAEDSYGNSVTENFTQKVEVDLTWSAADSLEGSSTFTENHVDLDPFKIENTGDEELKFNSSVVSGGNLSLTHNLSDSFSIPVGEEVWADFNASTSIENQTLAALEFGIKLNASNGTEVADPGFREVTGEAIFVNGPLVEISRSSFQDEIDQGATGRYGFNLSNIGEASMNSTSIEYSLPEGWSPINPDQTAGEIPAGGSTIVQLGADVSENAATGEQTIGVTASNTNNSFSEEFTVNVNEVEENDTTIIEDPGGGGGGVPSIPSGGGGERIPEGTSDKILQSTSSFELVRGQDQNFTINFTNPTDYNLSNITVEASGFRAQYLDLKTEEIESLEVNESRPITVGITAPDFFASQSFELDFTISGKGYDSEAVVDPYFNFTLNKVVGLEIKEISRSRAENLTEQIEDIRESMESEGLPVRDVNGLLSEAEESIEEGSYGQVQQRFDTVQAMYSTGSETKEELQTLQEQISTARTQGLSVSQSRRMMNLAEAALDRGAYETASNRLDEAQNLYQLETKGQVNYIYLITSNWMKILGGITVLWIISLLGYYRFRLYRINSRLDELEDRESNIREMKIQDQKKAFEEQSMSLDAYEDAVDNYNQELIDLIEERTELESKKANITNLEREKALRQERDQLKEIITEAQEDYVKGDIADTGMYETKVEELTEKLSTVESELAEIEAKSKKNNSKLQLKDLKKWKEKLKASF